MYKPKKDPSAPSSHCPICGSFVYGLMPIDYPGITKFGCDKCHLRLTGSFFVHKKTIAETTSCPFGHTVNPADSLAAGEPADSKRVGWVKCPGCKRIADVFAMEVLKKSLEVSFLPKTAQQHMQRTVGTLSVSAAVSEPKILPTKAVDPEPYQLLLM